MSARVYRGVRVDYTYIPKNAYESFTFFRVLNHCENWVNPPELTEELGKSGFWKEQEAYKTKTRPSTKEHRSEVEVIRDMLDFAAYIGLLHKKFDFKCNRRTTFFRLSDFGKNVCNKINKKDITVREDLAKALLDYKITNSKIDIKRYAVFNNFSVRPWFVLLHLLHEFQLRYPRSSLKFHPKELTYAIISVSEETEKEFNNALQKMYEFSRSGVFQKPKKGSMMDWTLLNRFLSEDGYNPRDYQSVASNSPARLLNWSFFVGLIDCKTNIEEPLNFFDVLNSMFHIKEVYGLTSYGKKIYEMYKRTRYFAPTFSFYDEEILISTFLNKSSNHITIEELQKAFTDLGICDKLQFERSVESLKSKRIINLEKGVISLLCIPIIDDISRDIIRDIEDKSEKLSKELSLRVTIPTIEPIGIRHIAYEDVDQILEYNTIKGIASNADLNEFRKNGLDTYFIDYFPLSIGDERLKGLYSDIRELFEEKTAKLLEQMNFERVDHIGQKVGRGESYPDIVAIWKRINGIKRHITIIECKSNKDKSYSLLPTDVDRRIGQIKNLMNMEDYKLLSDKIDTILFVSSGFAGDYRNKMLELIERASHELNLNIRVACITSTDLLYLYSKYRRFPAKFENYNLKLLFNEDLIKRKDIDKIFI